MKRFIFSLILIMSFLFILYGSNKLLNTKTYKIRFNSNGGAKVASILVKENKTVENLPLTSRENYEFVGWYLDDEPFNLSLNINKDYTLTAVWKKVEEKTYKIFFDSLSTEKINTIEIKEGETLKEFPTPTKEGYEFLYWTYQNKAITELTGTKDLTLIAKYKKIN